MGPTNGGENSGAEAQSFPEGALRRLLPGFPVPHERRRRKVPAAVPFRKTAYEKPPPRIAHKDGHPLSIQGNGRVRGSEKQKAAAFVRIFDPFRFQPLRNVAMRHDATPPNKNRCTRLTVADASALAELESRCFALPWTAKAFAEALEGSVFSAFGLWDGAGGLAGYIGVYHTLDEVEILNIAVREDRRRQGCGRLLMSAALREAVETGILRAVLEVRTSNAPAIGLYESLGFRKAGKRRGYYQDTGEDALIYVLDMDPASCHHL